MCAASAASQSSPASRAASKADSKSGSAASLSPLERRRRPRSRSTRIRDALAGLLRRLVEQAIALVEALAETLDARELRQRLRAERTEALLGAVEVVEVPVRAQRIHQRPVVEKCW